MNWRREMASRLRWVSNFLEKITPWIKWSLVVWILLMGAVLYFNFVEVVKHLFIPPSEAWLESIGYMFKIDSIFDWFLKLIVPASILPIYVIKLESDSIREGLSEIVKAANFLQLVILAVLLPVGIFYQSKIYGYLLKNENN